MNGLTTKGFLPVLQSIPEIDFTSFNGTLVYDNGYTSDDEKQFSQLRRDSSSSAQLNSRPLNRDISEILDGAIFENGSFFSRYVFNTRGIVVPIDPTRDRLTR